MDNIIQTLTGAVFYSLISKKTEIENYEDYLKISSVSSLNPPTPMEIKEMLVSASLSSFNYGQIQKLTIFDTVYPHREKRDTVILTIQSRIENGIEQIPTIKPRENLLTIENATIVKSFIPVVGFIFGEIQKIISAGYLLKGEKGKERANTLLKSKKESEYTGHLII
jgi:hypothetical protein